MHNSSIAIDRLIVGSISENIDDPIAKKYNARFYPFNNDYAFMRV